MTTAHVPPFVDNDASTANRVTAAWLNALAAAVDAADTDIVALQAGGALTIQANGVNTTIQTTLNILDGDNISVTDNGDGSVTVAVTGIGSTIQAYDADTAKLDTVQSYTKAQRGTPAALTSSGGAIAIDMTLGNNFSHTMTEDTTIGAPSNMVAGQSGAILITQHASAAKTLAFNAAWILPSGGNGTITTTLSGKSMVLYSTFDASTVLYDVRNLT